MRIVVVGASLAGVRTVEALRRRGSDADVVLVGAEPGSPDGVAADRPPLSKGFLADPAVEARPLTDRQRLGALGVELVCGRAVDLDRDRRQVALHGGESVAYDRLVVATGSTPRTVPGLEPRAGVWTLRTAADAAAIRAAATEGARVVVVGGGFIGAEVAWTLHGHGRTVALVEPLPALLVRGLGPELGAALTRRHAAAGIDLHTGAGVAALEGRDRVTGVRLTDGTLMPADLVVLGLGTVPETGWLAGAGLDLRDGVVCDERLAAVGAEDVWAVGDVARWRHPRVGEDVRVEHWTNAVETAGVVAANLTGTPTAHDAVPYVWSDQLGARLQVFGRVRPGDELRVVVGDLDGSFVAITGSEGRLRAAVGFGALKALLPFRKLLVAGAGWDEALAAA
ncbi:Reductase C-terminal [Geodermatophilus dictyosporus]|uniref:Reductase C-terminal n=1 Tax=Geodermatophilus dictyosporus TaxID=1523247 RepID=A0A1I5QSV4_9ACTN|nr:FAD-dependent oxidoreductase [Geodermatophilus dictyosporus]SFP49111.1 Reductase C-terminal [Geodermatophilus dictyosporus]